MLGKETCWVRRHVVGKETRGGQGDAECGDICCVRIRNFSNGKETPSAECGDRLGILAAEGVLRQTRYSTD